MDPMISTAEFYEAFGIMPSTLLMITAVASIVRAWKFKGIARYISFSSAFFCLCLMMQLYFTPFSIPMTFVIVFCAILSWTISLMLTRGWYLLIEIVVLPIVNILSTLITGAM